MKKALLAMLILCLLFWIAGCGGNGGSGNDGAESSSTGGDIVDDSGAGNDGFVDSVESGPAPESEEPESAKMRESRVKTRGTGPYLVVPEYVGASTAWVEQQLGEPTNTRSYQMAGSNAPSVTQYTYDTTEDQILLEFIDGRVASLTYSVKTDPYIPFNFDDKAEIFDYFAITPGADMQIAADGEYSAMFSNVTADILQVSVQFTVRETQSCSLVNFVFDEAFRISLSA